MLFPVPGVPVIKILGFALMTLCSSGKRQTKKNVAIIVIIPQKGQKAVSRGFRFRPQNSGNLKSSFRNLNKNLLFRRT